MTLKDLHINPTYNTSKDDLINNFFVPLLDNSKKYDRGVGYFSSSWINEALEEMLNFANNGGSAHAWLAGSNARGIWHKWVYREGRQVIIHTYVF